MAWPSPWLGTALLVAFGVCPGVRAAGSFDDNAVLFWADDVSALIQRTSTERPHRKQRKNSTSHQWTLHRDNFLAVSRASLHLEVARMKIHYYDVAMYLDETSELWGQSFNATGRRQAMELMLGKTLFIVVPQTTLVRQNALVSFVNSLMPFAKAEHVKDAKQVFKHYKEELLQGPSLKKGVEVQLQPNRSWVNTTIAGTALDSTDSSWLGLVMEMAYLGEKSLLPEFKELVWKQLATGKPSELPPSVEIWRKTPIPWYAFVIAVVLVAGLVGLLFVCFRRRSHAPVDVSAPLQTSG